MSGYRLPTGGLIDRSRKVKFTFDGRAYVGHPGDTLASALLANGVQIIGRSFKYHRARGIWGAWVDDANAVMNIRLGGLSLPNMPAATTPLQEGMEARAVNAWPRAARDVKGGLDLFHALMPAGFYYKTFMWPDWHLFEPRIRAMAGLGALEESADFPLAAQSHAACDLLVIGGGPAGLAAAEVAAEAGQRVWLVDDHPQAGGGVYAGGPIEGQAPTAWVRARREAIQRAGGRVMVRTTAIGAYDHGMVALAVAGGFAQAPKLIRVRPRRVLLASGALDRPAVFANNDRPGVMATSAALEFSGRYGVCVGQRIAVIGRDTPAAGTLRDLGAEVVEIDPSSGLRAIGRTLRAVQVGGARIACDTLLASAGRTPLVHLWRHAGGGLEWEDAIGAFVPGRAPENWAAIGAANGVYRLDAALEEARTKARGPSTFHPRAPEPHIWPDPGGAGRQWVDFQHDVTLKDIAMAAREGYGAVEHLKRYTTLGMANDQGRVANINALAILAKLRGKTIPEVGTTTFRPPYVPVPLALYSGPVRGQLFHPLKRLALEGAHRANDAAMGEYGGWLRPAWYGKEDGAVVREVAAVRGGVGVFDASPLGKIEVLGPDAAAFVNFIYYNDIKSLTPGHIRYGFMLREDGVVFDDGVITCITPAHYLISCSSSHVDAVLDHLEAWRQDGHDPERIYIHDSTANNATLTLTGPNAARMCVALELDVAGLKHMQARAQDWHGARVRISRVSFTGEASFEVSLPPPMAGDFWGRAQALGARPVGLEAMSLLRAEKGYIIPGKDTDGATLPQDLGFTGPIRTKRTAFVGDHAVRRAADDGRRHLVGLENDGAPIAVGSHLVDGARSVGVVTSSYFSPTLNRPIALAQLENGRALMGETATCWHLGETRAARVVAPCFYDPKGARLHA